MAGSLFAIVLDALPIIVGSAFCLFLLYGFWRGLSLRPHKPEHRPNERIHWWWGPGN